MCTCVIPAFNRNCNIVFTSCPLQQCWCTGVCHSKIVATLFWVLMLILGIIAQFSCLGHARSYRVIDYRVKAKGRRWVTRKLSCGVLFVVMWVMRVKPERSRTSLVAAAIFSWPLWFGKNWPALGHWGCISFTPVRVRGRCYVYTQWHMCSGACTKSRWQNYVAMYGHRYSLTFNDKSQGMAAGIAPTSTAFLTVATSFTLFHHTKPLLSLKSDLSNRRVHRSASRCTWR